MMPPSNPTIEPAIFNLDLVPGRSCDGCTLCCKLMGIEDIGKARGQWCPDCDKTRGCKIYDTRPEACRTFHCGYLRIGHLDERWKPSKARFLINFESAANRIVIHADPDRPDAWKRAPYYAQIKHWSHKMLMEGGYLMVWCGPEATIVMPWADKPLGRVNEDQYILRINTGGAPDFVVVEPDDPRVT